MHRLAPFQVAGIGEGFADIGALVGGQDGLLAGGQMMGDKRRSVPLETVAQIQRLIVLREPGQAPWPPMAGTMSSTGRQDKARRLAALRAGAAALGSLTKPESAP